MDREGEGTKFWIDRKLFTSDIWFDSSPWRLKIWLYLIGHANHTDNYFMGIPLKRGQLIRSYRTISEDCGYNIEHGFKKPGIGTIHRIMHFFKDNDMILLEKIGKIPPGTPLEHQTEHPPMERSGYIITILNYSKLQSSSNKPGTPNGTPNGTPLRNKIRIDKNVKDISNSKELLVDADAPTTGSVEVITKNCPNQEIILIYHDTLPELNQIKVWDDTAKKYLKTRWREDPERQFPSWWKAFFIYVKESPFLMGHNDRGWQADLRWLVKPTNFAKVMNGNFHQNKRPFAGAMDFIEGDEGGK